MQLSDLFADSSPAGKVSLRSATSGEQSAGAAMFATMVLQALRETEADVEHGGGSGQHVAGLSPDVAEDQHEIDAQITGDLEVAGHDFSPIDGSLKLNSPEGASADSTLIIDGMPDSGPSVVAIGIGGDSAGSPHVDGRHAASEAADLVLSELRTILESSSTASATSNSEIEKHLSAESIPHTSLEEVDSEASPEKEPTSETSPGRSERNGTSRSETSSGGLLQSDTQGSAGTKLSTALPAEAPVDRSAGLQDRKDGVADVHSREALRAQASATITAADIEPSRTAAFTLPSESDVDPEIAQQEGTGGTRESGKITDAAPVSRAVGRSVAGTEADADVPAYPAEKDGTSGKGVRSEAASRSDNAAIPAEFRAIHSEIENGQSIASTPEEFFETENVSVEELSEVALPAGESVEATSDGRSGEGRTVSTADALSERPGTPREVSMPRAVVSAAWLRAMMEQGLRIHDEPEGWNSVTMRLGDEDGTMTVRTRREDGAMAVQVAFSDPGLRNMAAQNVERLEAALRAQYETTIDLSLSDSDTRPDDDRRASPAPDRSKTSVNTDHDTRDIARRSPWARNEWVV